MKPLPWLPVGESIAAAPPADGELPPEFAAPTPVAIAVEADSVAWSAGDPNAPVQIVEFTDYQCPFCQQYAMETFPTLFTEMIESGRIFYALKDLPLDNLHPEAIVAATAVRCAGEQDAYKAMHDAVFANQALWGGSGETAAINIFTDLAVDLELDSEALTSCIDLGEQRERVLANQQESLALGVSSTPIFYINGYPMRGAQPFDVFEAVIELAENDELEVVIEAQARQAYEQAQAQAAQPQAPEPPSGPVDIPIGDSFAIGDPNAPITIIEYTDFQCPFCSRHFEQTFPQIKDDLIDAGLVYYVFKDFPLTQIHPQAVLAASAARCAGEQDAYLAMHDTLFSTQAAWNGRSDADTLFNQYAAEMGLDGDQFATCLANGTYEDSIYAELNEGASFGVNGTPAFFINGYFLSGAQPYDTFVDAVSFFTRRSRRISEAAMKRWQVGQLLGVEIWFTQNSLLLSGLLWLILSGAAAVWLNLTVGTAVLVGFTAVCLHWLGELTHQMGHAWVARRVGYPMQCIVSWTVLMASRYPKDEPPLRATIHIQRALGGPAMSLLVAGLSGLILLLIPVSPPLSSLIFFVFAENLLVFCLGAFLPLGFTDGSTLLEWWPRRHEPK